MEDTLYSEIFDYNIIPFLVPIDIYHLIITCKSFRRIKHSFLEQKIIGLIHQKLHEIFGNLFDDFWDLLCKSNAKITGAFIVALMLGLETKKINIQIRNKCFSKYYDIYVKNIFLTPDQYDAYGDFFGFYDSILSSKNTQVCLGNFRSKKQGVSMKLNGIKMYITQNTKNDICTFECSQNSLEFPSLTNIFHKRLLITNDDEWKSSYYYSSYNYQLMYIYKEYLRLGFIFYSSMFTKLRLREIIKMTEETIIKLVPCHKDRYVVTSKLYNFRHNNSENKTESSYEDILDILDIFDHIECIDGYICGHDNFDRDLTYMYECDHQLPNKSVVIGCNDSVCYLSYLYPNINHLHGENNIVFIDKADEIFFC
jgi:hypothetical protein